MTAVAGILWRPWWRSGHLPRPACPPGLVTAVHPRPPAAGEADPELVTLAQHGDHDAFLRLVRHYDDRLRALAFGLLADRDRMDDALQEAYFKAWRALGSFRRQSSFGTWMYRIAYNACIDELRRPSVVAPLLCDDGREPASAAPGPAELAVERGDVAAALAELAPEQRAAVLLVDGEGLDYSDACAVLGVPAGTLASRLHRARAALRARLGMFDG